MRATRGRRIGLGAALAWLLATGLTGTIAWRAVAVIDNGSARTGVLSQSEVSSALDAARTATVSPTAVPTPAATASSTPSSSASSSPNDSPTPTPAPTRTSAPSVSAVPSKPSPEPPGTPPPPQPGQPAAVARTWSVTGGTVAALCTGSTIELLYATPQDGWTVEIGSTGPERVEVELKRHDQETTVRAACVDGTPQQTANGGSPDDKDH